MKLLLLCLALTITSCQPHIPNPPVKEILHKKGELFCDISDSSYWSKDTVQLDSLRLSIATTSTATYLVTINEFSKKVQLQAGQNEISFGWNEFSFADTLRITIADERVLEELTSYSIPVRKFTVPMIRNLKVPFKKALFDSVNMKWFSEKMEPLNSLRVSFNVRTKSDYILAVNGKRHRYSLGTSDTSLALDWNTISLAEYLVIELYEINQPTDISKLIVPVQKIIPDSDPLLQYCWHIKPSNPSFVNTYNMDTASHVNVTSVWETNRGAGVKVAILDNGIQPHHEDLAGNVISTWDVSANSSTIVPDYSSHGTAVAGMVGAVRDNSIGISGIAPEASLILIQVDIDGSEAGIIKAFQAAKERGAQVINCSWGSYNVSEAVESIIQEMYDAGIVVVFAAGNRGISLDNLPHNGESGKQKDEAELPTVIGVGGLSEQNDYWPSADYGSNLELIAPAGGTPGVTLLAKMGDGTSDELSSNYRFWSGCSFAAPLVAGVAALILAENPLLTPAQVRTILISSTDKVGGEKAQYNAAGFDQKRLYGKVNAQKAVALARKK